MGAEDCLFSETSAALRHLLGLAIGTVLSSLTINCMCYIYRQGGYFYVKGEGWEEEDDGYQEE